MEELKMPNPSQPISTILANGKSHRTKAEIEQRQKAEASLATGEAMKMRKEVKDNEIAKKEFKRVDKLLSSIGKNDALVEGSVNRYAELTSECLEFVNKRENFSRGIRELEDFYENECNTKEEKDRILNSVEYFQLLTKMEASLINIDKQIMSKRKMLLDLEKENLMTIASQLRSIPKNVNDNENDEDGMESLLNC